MQYFKEYEVSNPQWTLHADFFYFLGTKGIHIRVLLLRYNNHRRHIWAMPLQSEQSDQIRSFIICYTSNKFENILNHFKFAK